MSITRGMASRALKNRSLYLKLYEKYETRQSKFSHYTYKVAVLRGPITAHNSKSGEGSDVKCTSGMINLKDQI